MPLACVSSTRFHAAFLTFTRKAPLLFSSSTRIGGFVAQKTPALVATDCGKKTAFLTHAQSFLELCGLLQHEFSHPSTPRQHCGGKRLKTPVSRGTLATMRGRRGRAVGRRQARQGVLRKVPACSAARRRVETFPRRRTRPPCRSLARRRSPPRARRRASRRHYVWMSKRSRRRR